jgi:hypothetical protein
VSGRDLIGLGVESVVAENSEMESGVAAARGEKIGEGVRTATLCGSQPKCTHTQQRVHQRTLQVGIRRLPCHTALGGFA